MHRFLLAGHKWPALAILMVAVSAGSAAAAPSVLASVSVSDGNLRVAIQGSDFPEMKSAMFVCSYDTSSVAIYRALISSPIPSAALGASLNKPAQQLHIFLTATSVLKPGNGSDLAVLTAPLTNPSHANSAILLIRATLVSTNGDSIAVEISPVDAVRNAGLIANLRIRKVEIMAFTIDGRKIQSGPATLCNGPFVTRQGRMRIAIRGTPYRD
jgi:hypothetical protein